MAQNAKDIQLRELKELLSELRKTSQLLLKTLEETQKEKAVLRQERDNFKEQVDYLTKKLFGSSSEKGACEIPGQMNLFNEAESEMDPSAGEGDVLAATEQPEQARPGSKAKKKRSTNEERFKGIPVKKVYLEPSARERICRECGAEMKKTGTEFVRRELEIIPARARVIEYYSVNYGCRNCRQNAALPNIVKGRDGKAHVMYGMASASTVAWVVYQKYCNGMPLYRTEQDLGRLGAKVSRATLANWVIKNGEAFFTPMYDFFHRKLLDRDFAMADETPVQVLHEPGRRAETKSYIWLFRSGEDCGLPIILYKYSETRAGDTAEDFLDAAHGAALHSISLRPACIFPPSGTWRTCRHILYMGHTLAQRCIPGRRFHGAHSGYSQSMETSLRQGEEASAGSPSSAGHRKWFLFPSRYRRNAGQ